MSPILASELSGKQVMSTDGQHVGNLHNVTMHSQSGDLQTIIVETERTEIFGVEENENGRIHLSAEVLEAVRDHLIITPPTAATPE